METGKRVEPSFSEHSMPAEPRSLNLFQFPSGELSRTIFTLNAYLEERQKWEGASYNQWMAEWIGSGLTGEAELREWLRERFCPERFAVRGKKSHRAFDRAFDLAQKQAEEWCRQGIWAAGWESPGSPPRSSLPRCPRVFFGTGETSWTRPLVAVFNSRKGRQVSPHEEWLRALRLALSRITAQKGEFAGSLGTTTYDLVTAYARRAGLPLFLIVPFPVEDFPTFGHSPLLSSAGERPFHTMMTCHTRAVRCSKATRMLCRDRILACIADLHHVLEIRSGGNLLAVLQEQQRRDPRPQRIWQPQCRGSRAEGNLQLLAELPAWSQPFAMEVSDEVPLTENSLPLHDPANTRSIEINWEDYLYHYTRARPGPWPGQSYRDYLLNLLDGDPLSEHTALHTLVHILTEGRIRAGSQLVRGDQPVTSWTAIPPRKLESIRKWNPALIRWTFEPYGIAIRRSLLRRLGAKPTIYAGDAVYSRLKPFHRFRFQRHEAPHCSWKHEREWRLPKDFLIEECPAGSGFIIVPAIRDAEMLMRGLKPPLPLLVLSFEDGGLWGQD